METKNIIDKKKYKIPKNIIEQKDIRLSKYGSFLEAIKNKSFDFDADITVLVLAKDGKMYEVNLIGAIVWEYLKKGYNFDKMIKIISEFFEADHNLIEKDIDFFFQDLLKNGFVEKS